MFGGAAKSVIPVLIPEMSADGTQVVYRAPKGQGKVTITGASMSRGAQAGGASNGAAYTLRKRGVDGAATAVAISGKLGAASGGTHPAWEAGKPLEFNIIGDADGESDVNVLLPGEVVDVEFDKTGTDASGVQALFLEVALGVA